MPHRSHVELGGLVSSPTGWNEQASYRPHVRSNIKQDKILDRRAPKDWLGFFAPPSHYASLGWVSGRRGISLNVRFACLKRVPRLGEIGDALAAILLELAVEGLAVHAEDIGGSGLVTMHIVQYLENVSAFEVAK